jgi:hypothetical protein
VLAILSTRLPLAFIGLFMELAGCVVGISDPGIVVFAENTSGHTSLLRFHDGATALTYEIPAGQSGLVTIISGASPRSFELLDSACVVLETETLESSGDWLIRISEEAETPSMLRVEPTQGPRAPDPAFGAVTKCDHA